MHADVSQYPLDYRAGALVVLGSLIPCRPEALIQKGRDEPAHDDQVSVRIVFPAATTPPLANRCASGEAQLHVGPQFGVRDAPGRVQHYGCGTTNDSVAKRIPGARIGYEKIADADIIAEGGALPIKDLAGAIWMSSLVALRRTT
jgi:hypothetical protein